MSFTPSESVARTLIGSEVRYCWPSVGLRIVTCGAPGSSVPPHGIAAAEPARWKAAKAGLRTKPVVTRPRLSASSLEPVCEVVQVEPGGVDDVRVAGEAAVGLG